MDASSILADNIAGISIKDIPPEVVDITKKCILDRFDAGWDLPSKGSRRD